MAAIRNNRGCEKNCRGCELHHYRTQVVCGIGRHDSPVMLVGINPGRDEDRIGQPFVGPAGRLLTDVLAEIGLDRTELWITNVVKCKTPNNTLPTLEQATKCATFLQNELDHTQPEVVVAIGGFPLQILSGQNHPVLSVSGQVLGRPYYGTVTLPRWAIIIPLIHPAAVLRQPQYRTILAQSLQRLEDILTRKKILL